MTILQLKYIVAIANSGSMREASGKLFVTQPALSASIRDLEEELGIRIFERNNRGVILTEKGTELLDYAKQVVNQYELIEEKYINGDEEKKFFSVSMQHYVFALHAFINTILKENHEKYTYSVQETRTDEVIYNVRDFKSEIGIIAYSESNKNILKKLFRESELEFHPLMVCNTYAYVCKNHPLADKTEISLEDLKEYPCVTFDQNSDKDFYISEEALSDRRFNKLIKSNDRATSAEIMAILNGYAIGTGIMTESVALQDFFVSIKLREEDPLTIGYIIRKNHILSDFGKVYINELEKYRDRGQAAVTNEQ